MRVCCSYFQAVPTIGGFFSISFDVVQPSHAAEVYIPWVLCRYSLYATESSTLGRQWKLDSFRCCWSQNLRLLVTSFYPRVASSYVSLFSELHDDYHGKHITCVVLCVSSIRHLSICLI